MTFIALVALEQPVVEFVKVIIDDPALSPVTNPAFVTVAINGNADTQLPPVIGVNVVVPPIQIEVEAAVTVGRALIVTVEVVLVQVVEVCSKVNVTFPAATPVATPALVTVALPVLLDVQVPPDVGDNVAVEPTQIELGAVTVGKLFIVTLEVVRLHPVDVGVKINVTVPAETGVITPAFVTVATAVFVLDQVPPVVGDKVPVDPIQTEVGDVNVGNAFIVKFPVVA